MYSGKTVIAKEFIKRLDACNGPVYIFGHKNVDGDCIGASCGLCEVLRNLGYESKVLIGEDLPEYMDYLSVSDYLIRVNEGDNYTPSLAIATDCAEGHRMGITGKFFEECDNKLVVDHHASVTIDADNYWIVPDASSASELTYYLSQELCRLKGRDEKEVITKNAAILFLTGIVTDTGRFAYTNTNPETLEVSGELTRLGATISPIMFNCFDRKSQGKLKITSLACLKAQYAYDGKIATSIVTDEMYEECGAGLNDISEVVSRLRDVEGVVVAIVLRQADNGQVRVNVRSHAPFDSSKFAEEFGGGGHVRAAGCTVNGKDIFELREEMVKRAIELLNE